MEMWQLLENYRRIPACPRHKISHPVYFLQTISRDPNISVLFALLERLLPFYVGTEIAVAAIIYMRRMFIRGVDLSVWNVDQMFAICFLLSMKMNMETHDTPRNATFGAMLNQTGKVVSSMELSALVIMEFDLFISKKEFSAMEQFLSIDFVKFFLLK